MDRPTEYLHFRALRQPKMTVVYDCIWASMELMNRVEFILWKCVQYVFNDELISVNASSINCFGSVLWRVNRHPAPAHMKRGLAFHAEQAVASAAAGSD
jgi:hypothetical protein